jgi:hypothetical protein
MYRIQIPHLLQPGLFTCQGKLIFLSFLEFFHRHMCFMCTGSGSGTDTNLGINKLSLFIKFYSYRRMCFVCTGSGSGPVK